ncbi:MAG: amino acid ABC transporter permease [Clostridiales bacterium]|nr:amino acid ABC transporter permease [Clostridiales bacterium]
MSLETIYKLVTNMLSASAVTLEVFFLTLLFSLPLGLLVASLRMSKYKIIQLPIRFYLLIMRGTPLILQLIFIYFLPSQLGDKLSVTIPMLPRFGAAILAFTLNYAAYFAEIYRGGIQAVPTGQHEAAAVLGLSKVQTFFRVVLPQVIKNILPAMGNEFMTLVKDTALAQTIGVMEIFRLAKSSTSTNSSILPMFVAGLFYLIMNSVVSKGFSSLGKRLDYYK